MRRLTLAELDASCQKLDHQRLGNWMARKISRPMALRVTQVIAPWGVSANVATLVAWSLAVVSAISFGSGTIAGQIVGAVLLQLWYLFDHVDGQLARLRKTESLDGVALDYLMHHTVNLLIPIGVGYGLCLATVNPSWLLVGIAWGASLLIVGLKHDIRYKAFVQRLKRVRGDLIVTGGGGGRPAPNPPLPRTLFAGVRWFVNKAGEMHVIMNALAIVALVELVSQDHELRLLRWLVIAMSGMAALRAINTVRQILVGQQVENEFRAWFHPAANESMTYQAGWWVVSPMDAVDSGNPATSSDVSG